MAVVFLEFILNQHIYDIFANVQCKTMQIVRLYAQKWTIHMMPKDGKNFDQLPSIDPWICGCPKKYRSTKYVDQMYTHSISRLDCAFEILRQKLRHKTV